MTSYRTGDASLDFFSATFGANTDSLLSGEPIDISSYR